MSRARRILGGVSTLRLAAGASVVAALPASAATGLTATFSAEDRGSYFWDKYVVANTTSASITGWTIEFDLPAGVTVSQFFYAVVTQSGGHVVATNEYYNSYVQAQRTTEQ